MGWFAGRTPEDRVADAAFGAAWDTLDPVDRRVRLDQPSLDAAWSRALPAAAKAGKKLPDDVMRLQAQKGFSAAVARWDARVADMFATKRRVVTEAAYTTATASFASLGGPDEVRTSLVAAQEQAGSQARWLNDGVYALGDDDFAASVQVGVGRAADERIRQLTAPTTGARGGAGAPSEPIALNDATGRAREMARDAARYAAVAALSSRSQAEVAASGEAVAMDAAAAAVQALPDEICNELDDDEQAAAVIEGAGEALRDQGWSPGSAAATGTPPGETTTAPPPGAASGTYAGPPPGFFGQAGAAVGPAAGKAASGAKVTQQRLSIAAKVKHAVDAKMPEASGYGLSQPESDRAYAAARSAALEHNERIGSPFRPEEALRIADITTTTIITTWYAVGHLQRSGASEAVGGMARDAAKRLLGSTRLPPTLIDYLVDEAVRAATPEWGRTPPAGGGSDRWADRAAAARGRAATYTYRGRQVPNYYELLQVSSKASHEVIEKAWRVLIAQSHPDIGGDPVRAAQLNEAREILLDPDARRAYDQENGF